MRVPRAPRGRTLRDENDSLRAQLRQAEARYKRLLKSQEKRAEDDRALLIAKLVDALLPTLDTLELASQTEPSGAAMRDGLVIAYRELVRTLKGFGMDTHLPKAGETFDPSAQEAASYEEAAGQAEGTILRVLRAGYSIAGRFLRPALVSVARRTDAGVSADQGDRG